MTAKDHNKTIGTLFLVYLGLQVFGVLAIGFFSLIFGGFAISKMHGPDATPIAFVVVIMLVALVISAALLIPVAIGGWKMFKEKPNSKTWGIIASVVALLNFPLGTALGIYALWFLMGTEGKAFYDGNRNQNMGSYNPPPPPNSWQ